MRPYNDGYFFKKVKRPADRDYMNAYRDGEAARMKCLTTGVCDIRPAMEEKRHKDLLHLYIVIVFLLCCLVFCAVYIWSYQAKTVYLPVKDPIKLADINWDKKIGIEDIIAGYRNEPLQDVTLSGHHICFFFYHHEKECLNYGSSETLYIALKKRLAHDTYSLNN